MSDKPVSEMSFEEALAELERVVGDLERGDVALEASIKLYERGAELKKRCEEKLKEAGDGIDQGSKRKLLNLRNRLARIRVFDPACGSGNFLVIAYKQMRAIEAEINRRRGETEKRTEIPLTNFRGIELRHFACEIARLALVIAEYQCDALHRGETLARAEFLPLDQRNWITQGNALRIDWLTVCPPTGTDAKLHAEDLFETPLDQAEIGFENEGGETYLCGNPPYSGKGKKQGEHLGDMEHVFSKKTAKFGYVDYVGCWLVLASDYCRKVAARASLVATNSICQGRQLPQLWPHVLDNGVEIFFAHHSFKWANSAARNAGVTCVIVGIAPKHRITRKVLTDGNFVREADHINAYLIAGNDLVVNSRRDVLSAGLHCMETGSVPNDGGNMILSRNEVKALKAECMDSSRLIHPFYGSKDYLQGLVRFCLVISDQQVDFARSINSVNERLDAIESLRSRSKKKETREELAQVPHRFQHRGGIPRYAAIIVPSVSSERRPWFPAGTLPGGTVISNLAFMMLDAEVWNLALVLSKLHLVWVSTVCGKLKTDFRYSNTLGWNTFPVPSLSEQNKADLARCAEDILLARESYWPATIADMYDPDRMDNEFPEVRAAHDRNDETLERIYIGRWFKNDTERLEKLFAMYTEMTAAELAESGAKG